MAEPAEWLRVQNDITHRMRNILIDWLGEVVTEYKLNAQTLFLTVNYIDRFLCQVPVHRSKLQLVGISCLLIASKIEETRPLLVEELLYICDNAYDRDQLLELELDILTRLKFLLCTQTCHSYLLRHYPFLDLSQSIIIQTQVFIYNMPFLLAHIL